MRNKAAFLFIFILFLPSILHAWEGKVVSVTDGDTIKILSNGTQVKVRLFAIDCPEKGQPWNKKAKQYTSLLVLHKTVTVLPVDEDRYGRIVAWVIFEEINVNKALLRAGLAWHYRQYSNDSLLTALEMEAQMEKKGIWSEPYPVPPWAWRKMRRNNLD